MKMGNKTWITAHHFTFQGENNVEGETSHPGGNGAQNNKLLTKICFLTFVDQKYLTYAVHSAPCFLWWLTWRIHYRPNVSNTAALLLFIHCPQYYSDTYFRSLFRAISPSNSFELPQTCKVIFVCTNRVEPNLPCFLVTFVLHDIKMTFQHRLSSR